MYIFGGGYGKATECFVELTVWCTSQQASLYVSLAPEQGQLYLINQNVSAALCDYDKL